METPCAKLTQVHKYIRIKMLVVNNLPLADAKHDSCGVVKLSKDI